MFWNTEFQDSIPSNIDVLLQLKTVELVDILFEDDLLTEVKTSNSNLGNFLTKPEIILELVENITQLNENDCCNRSIHSRIHRAYLSCEILTSGAFHIFNALMQHPDCLKKILTCLIDVNANETNKQQELERLPAQKVTLISKLINTIHSSGPDKLSCHITKEISSFSKLINTLISNIDISSSFDILSTFISKTMPPEMRLIFCEVLSKQDFVYNLIDVMTLSTNEDKQRNACQLLCDIIVIGRQEKSDGGFIIGIDYDMLSQTMQSSRMLDLMLKQIFTPKEPQPTTIICGLKVLQTIVEKKMLIDDDLANEIKNQIEEGIDEYLIKLHDILKNPPEQDSIKTTFGIIERPLGYLRFEIVMFIKALIKTKSVKLMSRLIELNIIQVTIDLFFEFSWNNLLHAQVEQALISIIDLCMDENPNKTQVSEPENDQDKGTTETIQFQALLNQLLVETDMIARFLEHLEPNIKCQDIEPAYCGHIMKILTHIKSNEFIGPVDHYIKQLKEDKPELYEKWGKVTEETKIVWESVWQDVLKDNDNTDKKLMNNNNDSNNVNNNFTNINNHNHNHNNNEDENSNNDNNNNNDISTTTTIITTNRTTTTTNHVDNSDSHKNNNPDPEPNEDSSSEDSDDEPLQNGTGATETITIPTSNSNSTKAGQQLTDLDLEIQRTLDTSRDLFSRELVFPRINKDVVPRIRRPKDAQ